MAHQVRIVCDSTADLEPAYRQAHGMIVVPLKVIFGEETLADGVDIQPDEFYERLKDPSAAPRTSQPAPAEFEAAFREAGADGATVVCTTISGALSGSMASAVAARSAVEGIDVRLVDTRTAALGHNAILKAAVAAAEAGAAADDVIEVIEGIKRTQRLVFTVPSLEFLKRGGRIGGARALLGSLLDIKPVLHVQDGAVAALDRVRTNRRAVERLVTELETHASRWGGRARVTVGHAARPDGARELAELARPFCEGEPVIVSVGPVIGCHAGPGAFGLAFHQPT